MKTNKLRSFAGMFRTISFLFVVLILIQCTGPRGPRGFDGEDGIDGIDGNVFAYSAIYEVPVNAWEGDFDGYYAWLNVPEINQDIFDNGAVLVYRFWLDNDPSFNMLPFTWIDNELTTIVDFDAYLGGINLIYKEIFDGQNDTFAPEGLMIFKVVIIEGIRLAVVKDMVNINDFSAVTKLFKLDDGAPGFRKVF